MSEYNKEYYRKNKEKFKQSFKERYKKLKENSEEYKKHLQAGRNWRKLNLAQDMWFQARKRAIQNGLEFNLEVNDIIIPDVCPVFGIKLERLDKRHNGSPSLDRIDSSKGYIKGNVQWIHKDVNIMKNKFNQEYFIEMCKLVASSNSSGGSCEITRI